MEVFFKVTGIEELKATLTKTAQQDCPFVIAKALTKNPREEVMNAKLD